MRNKVYKSFKLRGGDAPFAKLLELKKKKPELKILLSFSHGIENADNYQDGGFSCIAAKERYAAANGLRDLFYWCSYRDDADYTLSHAIWDAVQDNWFTGQDNQ